MNACTDVIIFTGNFQTFVRCAGDFDELTLKQFCTERIARYKVPAHIVRLDEFPMTAGANAPKVQKNRLREMAQALTGGF